jgi:hypothetical protein
MSPSGEMVLSEDIRSRIEDREEAMGRAAA